MTDERGWDKWPSLPHRSPALPGQLSSLHARDQAYHRRKREGGTERRRSFPEEATMAETVKAAKYFKMTVPNKAGEAARHLAVLRDAGVNLLACCGFPRQRRSQIDFVPEDTVAFKAAARKTGWKVEGPKTCFLVAGDDRAGALAAVLAKLVPAGINITAVAALAAGSGRYGAIVWVDPGDARKATKALGAS